MIMLTSLFSKKPRLSFVHTKTQSRFRIPPVSKAFAEYLSFRDGLVSTASLNRKFQICPVLSGWASLGRETDKMLLVMLGLTLGFTTDDLI